MLWERERNSAFFASLRGIKERLPPRNSRGMWRGLGGRLMGFFMSISEGLWLNLRGLRYPLAGGMLFVLWDDAGKIENPEKSIAGVCPG